MPTLGIIGSGNIGAAVARLAVAVGFPVVVANSRGPGTLTDLVAELGALATAGTVEQAAQAGEFVVLAVPLAAHTAIPAELLDGKIVLDASNYYPSRDGRIAELDEDKTTTSELIQRHFPGMRLVKAFNNILAHHIPLLARPAGAPDRTALPIAGDDADAKTAAAALIGQLGFDTVDAGPLAQSWRIEPETTAYTRLYLADPATPFEQVMQAPARPVPAGELHRALEAVERLHVADRTF
jgi:8-hydroxy-5-deazaflavin:NADPH oxidoreductase